MYFISKNVIKHIMPINSCSPFSWTDSQLDYLAPHSLLKSKIDGSVIEISGKKEWKKQEIDVLSEFWQLYTKNDELGQVWDNDWKMPREVGVNLTPRQGLSG